MGDQAAGPILMDIAAARLLHWNVDFDRGLRSNKPGGQCEAVMKLGPQLVRWGREGEVTASSANLFKLDPGQDRVFASAILLRLADTFRSGNNFVRVCILKVLLLEFKGRKWVGEGFPGENFEMRSATRKPFSVHDTHSRGRRRRGTKADGEGLLTKKRIENHGEVLRRIRSVIESGDPTSRALAIRVIGCLADLGKDSSDIQSLILQAIQSPHVQEVSAALFAMGCLSELSDDFADLSLQAANEMINAMETSPRVKILAARLFAKLGRLPVLSLQALEMGRKTLLRYPTDELVTTMLTSLTTLASESGIIVTRQVDLLLMYIAHDPRMHVRAVALKCLGRLIPQVFSFTNSAEDIFNAVFAAVQDTDLPETLHEIALAVIRKLCHQLVATMRADDLVQIISWVELTALRDSWAVKSQALALLVDMVSDLMKFKLENESPQRKAEFTELSLRVCLLLCDQLAIVSSDTLGPRSITLGQQSIQSSSVSMNGSIMLTSTGQKAPKISSLLVKFVKCNSFVARSVVSSVGGIMEALAKGNSLGRISTEDMESDDVSKTRLDRESEAMVVDVDSEKDRKDHRDVREDSGVDGVISGKPKHVIPCEVQLLLKGLGRTLSSIVYALGYDARAIENSCQRLRSLANGLITMDCPASTLCPVSEALMKLKLLLNAATFSTSESDGVILTPRKVVDVNSTIERCGTHIMQKGSFWATYQLGKQGAIRGSWSVTESVFDGLVDKVSSEGCYFWLKALSYQAKAERALIHGSKVDGNQESQRRPEKDGSSETSRVESTMDVDGKEAFPSQSSRGLRNHQPQVDSLGLGRVRSAATQAIHFVRIALSSLAAGVCPERIFDFQRRVLRLRLGFLEAVSELAGLLTHANSLDIEAGAVNEEAAEMSDDLKRTWSALQASTTKAQIIASRLHFLSRKYDSLSVSSMGIDRESVKTLARTSLLCSLLTFCSVSTLPVQPTSSRPAVYPTLSVGRAALDVYHRLYQFDQEGLDDLLYFAIQNGSGYPSRILWGRTMELGPQECAIVHLCKSAVTSILGLQTNNNKLAGIIRGAALLEEILEPCLNLPWLSPPFFFCTRPRPGVDLFLAHAGPSNGVEAENLSVVRGSALALSVCLQIVNTPPTSLLACRRLICALAVQQADNVPTIDDDFQLGPEAGSIRVQLSQPTMLERLMMLSEATATSSLSVGPVESSRLGTVEAEVPEALFSVSVDSKGQGFGSCTVDVSELPWGEYQLMLYCICEDRDRRHWIFPLLSPRPKFWVA